MAKDAGTKQDQPSDQEGKGTPAKEELETTQAAEAAAQSKAAEKAEAKPKKKPAAKKKPAVKKSEGTAAAETGVEKAAAESALEGAEVPGDDEKAEAAVETKPKPRRSRAKKADAEPKAKASKQPEPAKPAKSARASRRRDRSIDSRVTVHATAKFVRSSPRKARLVTDHIKGKSVDEARAILAFSPRSVAEDWRKLLESAIANAEHNHDLVGDDLRVLNATADDGPTLKRFRPRAMGRATRIRKRTSHLTITLTPKE
jgi:ribosomal protein L22